LQKAESRTYAPATSSSNVWLEETQGGNTNGQANAPTQEILARNNPYAKEEGSSYDELNPPPITLIKMFNYNKAKPYDYICVH